MPSCSEACGDFRTARNFDLLLDDVLRDTKLFYHQLNQEEKDCVYQHLAGGWATDSQTFSPLKLRNLLKADFTYHDVDMRLFLPYHLRRMTMGKVCASCIYYYRGCYRIFIRFQYPVTNEFYD